MRGQLRIEQMFAFVVVDDDGTEGIPAFMGPDRVAMPLTGADMERVESLRPLAQKIATQLGKPITLVRFENRTEVEVIKPQSSYRHKTTQQEFWDHQAEIREHGG